MKSISNPLSELRDYHLPSAISWWPIAPGWWLLLLLILVAIGIIIGIWLYKRRKSATIRYAKIELIILQTNFAKDGNITNFIRGVLKLLRRFALTRFPRHQVAKLTGAAWLKFLDEHGGAGKFQNEFNWLLVDVPYQKEDALNLVANATQHVDKLAALVINWLRQNQEISKK